MMKIVKVWLYLASSYDPQSIQNEDDGDKMKMMENGALRELEGPPHNALTTFFQ